MKTLPTSNALKHALNAADYPATKDELIETARAAGADDTVLHALRALPPEEYRSLDEVIRSTGTSDPF